MKYHQLLELIKDESLTFYLSIPGLVQHGKIPEPCEIKMEKQLALAFANSVYTAFTNNGWTSESIDFQIACTGNDVVFLLNPAFPTVH